MSLISSAGNNFANVATSNINHNNNVNFQSNPQNNTQVRNPDAPQAVPQKNKAAPKKQDGNIAGGFSSSKSDGVNNIAKDENTAMNNFAYQQVDKQTLQEALDKIQDHLLFNKNTGLKFEIDEDSQMQIVKMIDKSNDDKLIKQIPSETALQIATALKELDKIKEGTVLSEKI